MMADSARDLPAFTELADERFARDPAFAYRAAHARPGPGLFRMPNGDGLIATAHRTLTVLMGHPAMGAQHRHKRRAGAGAAGALSRMDSYSPFFMNPPEHMPIAIATYRPMSPAQNRPLAEAVTGPSPGAPWTKCSPGAMSPICGGDYAQVIARDFWAGFLGLPAEAARLLEECSAAIVPMLKFENTAEEVDAANGAAQTMRDYLEEHHRTFGDSEGGTFLHLFEAALADSDWSEARRKRRHHGGRAHVRRHRLRRQRDRERHSCLPEPPGAVGPWSRMIRAWSTTPGVRPCGSSRPSSASTAACMRISITAGFEFPTERI